MPGLRHLIRNGWGLRRRLRLFLLSGAHEADQAGLEVGGRERRELAWTPVSFSDDNEMMNDDEQDRFHVTAEETKAQRAAVTGPGPHSLQAEELGLRPRIVGPQSPQASRSLCSPPPRLREVLSLGAAQVPFFPPPGT